MKIPTPAQMRKGIVAFLTLVGLVLTVALQQGDVIPHGALKYVVLVLGILNAAGVYGVRNEPMERTKA